jgi:hypothetical protein
MMDQRFSYSLYPKDELHVAWGRYITETWITSHPTLQACDLSPYRNIKSWHQSFTIFEKFFEYDARTFQWSHAPRYSYDDAEFHEHARSQRMALLSNATTRHHEWFLLPGILYRHYQLYRRVPPRDSWYWQWYPDGELWHNRFEMLLLPSNNRTTNTLDDGVNEEFWRYLTAVESADTAKG